MKFSKCLIFTGLLMSSFTSVLASPWTEHLCALWQSEDYDLMVPLNTWHNRWTYDHKKIKEYNERPWGLGLGKRYYDEDKDLHAFEAMVFMDSHKKPEPIAGYQFQKKWYYGEARDFSVGLGYSIGLTARHDYDWIPFPYVAPVLGFQFKNLSIENTYIPGTKNNGNVLFTWLRIEF